MTTLLNLKHLQPPKIEIFPGTANEPTIIDYPATAGMSVLAQMDHAHDFEGYCLKNRFGVRCDAPLPVDKEAEVISYVKEHLGDLLPWQEDFLRAVVKGEHLFEHKVRHVDTRKYEPHTYGFFETAKSVVDHKIDPSEWEIVSRPAFPFRSMK